MMNIIVGHAVYYSTRNRLYGQDKMASGRKNPLNIWDIAQEEDERTLQSVRESIINSGTKNQDNKNNNDKN